MKMDLGAGVAFCIIAAASLGVGRTVGHDAGYSAGYLKGYQDNIFYHHGCTTPEKADDTIECHRYPMYMGKNQNGLPLVRVKVTGEIFDRWIRARDDKEEPSSGVDCEINALGEVKDCNFPVG